MSFKLSLKKKAKEVKQEYCEKCGNFGHNSRNCGMGITCYKCGKVGHHGRDCTEDIRHESLAVQSAIEHGMMDASKAFYGEDRVERATDGITDWSERAKADKELADSGRTKRLREEDYAARESKSYDLLPTEDALAKQARREAKRRRKEEKALEKDKTRALLEELRRRRDNPPEPQPQPQADQQPSPSPSPPATPKMAPPPPPMAPPPPPPQPQQPPSAEEGEEGGEARGGDLQAEMLRRRDAAKKQKEEEEEEAERKLARVVRNKARQQGEHYTPPEWAARRRDTRLLVAVQKDGVTVETLDVADHPYYLFGKNAAVVDFPQEHPSISRVHLALVHNGATGETHIQDLGSQWGTRLNGAKLPPKTVAKIAVGGTFQLGASSRTFVLKERSLWG